VRQVKSKAPAPGDTQSSNEAKEAQEIKVGRYADVAPAAREGVDQKFGARPQNVMEKGQRPGDFR
jgi:hypothetical protein